jgi:regulator of protease activity HflC (stomatin/prohibitin superfamily)
MSNAALTLLPLVFAFFFLYMGLHQVPEGHVGLYYVGGALQEKMSEPGYHWMVPFITKMASVQTTLQTDTVTDIPCGTSGGVMIYFDKIEVVNQLAHDHVLQTVRKYGVNYDKTWIFDKIHHEINQFCSAHSLQEVYIELFSTLDEALSSALQSACTKWDTGITIVAIRVTKPRIPEKVRKNYEEVEQQKTSLMVAHQEQLVVVKREETARLQAKIQAEKEAEVSMINAQKEATVAAINAQREANVSLIAVEMAIKQKQGEQKKQLIENEMHVAKQKALAEALHHQITMEAEANLKKLTPEYLRLVLYQSLANNTKIFFGEKIPQIFIDWLPGSDGAGLFPPAPTKTVARTESKP